MTTGKKWLRPHYYFQHSYKLLGVIERLVKKNTGILKASLRKIKVDFLVAGTQKGGTSALDVYLRSHPQICMANRKEVHFFDNEKIFRWGLIKKLFYHSNFNPESHHRVIGESTPIYMYWTEAPKRIWQYNPEMKIIIILRNPVERAFSHWNMERDRNKDKLTFWDAIQQERERCRETLPFQHRVFSYVDRGFYSQQLRSIWHYFSEKQTLILKNEDLRYNPINTLKRVTDFLEIDAFHHIEATSVHHRPYITYMTSKEKDYLIYIYMDEIKILEKMLCWDCSDWLA